MNITLQQVVDSSTLLTFCAWMVHGLYGSIDVSFKKAKTARYFNMDTGEIGKLSQPGGSLYIEHSNGGLITFPGGVLINIIQGSPG